MPLSTQPLPLEDAALPALARWLLARRAGSGPDDLAAMLVLLPSQRAAGQLAHALLEAAGGSALILPRITTADRLAEHLRLLQDAPHPPDLPDPDLRPLVLAPHLARLDWLQERPEAAPGLAADLINLFDELRLARRDDLVLGDGERDGDLLRHLQPGAEEVLLADLQRLRSAWRLYREVLPEDQIDRRRDAFDQAGRQWPGRLPSLLAAAHLGRLDQVLADLLRGLSDQGVPVHWLTAGAEGPRSRLLLATYRDAEAPVSPLHGIRQLAARLGAELPLPPVAAGEDLATRLDSLQPEQEQVGRDGPIRLRSCRDSEHESRVVAEMVCAFLAAAADRPGYVEAGPPTILVATPDLDLAARIAAQLRDAGIDVDDSRGRPLAGLPAGRLLRDVLATVAGGWSFTPLLEVLHHPYVRLVPPGTRPGHAVQAQLLEAAIRRTRTARRGLETLLVVAAADDQFAGPARHSWSLQSFAGELATSLQPLGDLTSGAVRWQAAVAALESVWSALAPDRPLDGEPDPRHDNAHDDIGGVRTLLESLRQAAAWLEPAPLSVIAAAVMDLLTDPAYEVRPHRQQALPVRLVGLVEARLESADLLVLAGLGQDTFPGRLERPLFLPDHLRRQLGLKNWRRQAGDNAELFLRLLHVAPQVRLTWPRERDGRPALPSPLVQRLALAAGTEPEAAPEPPLRRRTVPDTARLAQAEVRHRAEPEPVPAPLIAPPEPLSHSAIQLYRECPYRFLMGSSLRLRRPDPLDAAFSAADVGTLAHTVMQRWLDPAGPGWAALAGGDGPAALAHLRQVALAVQDPQGAGRRITAVQLQLPGAVVSLQSLLALAPDLVAAELERAVLWQPAVLEGTFTLTVGEAARWLQAAEPEVPPLAIADAHRQVQLSGAIDRVDRRRDGTPRAAVIDYKTGSLPSKTWVRDGRLLQIHLYALAVETGAVSGLTAPPGATWHLDHAGFYGLRRRELGLPKQPHLKDRADFIAGVRTILQQVLAILDPQSPYALVPDWQDEQARGQLPCRTCEFRGICRLEERDKSPTLAARLAALLTESPRGVS